MIDVNWTIGHTEQLAVFIYQQSYRIASYKNVNHLEFVNRNLIYCVFLFRFLYFIMKFIYECFVMHRYFKLKQVTQIALLLNIGQ